jgi:hypothetical protein
MHSWNFDQPLRLIEQQADKKDQQPKALACYGVWFADEQQMLLRFAQARPVSELTCHFLEWVCERLAQKGKRVWVLVWDNASWHISQPVQAWIKEHNRQVKQIGGVRIIPCRLPVKSPWLNPIEPKWLHGKRAIVEPVAKLTADELIQRVYQYYHCQPIEPIAQNTT